MGITMPLPLGTPLTDFIEYYGQPTYGDYFLESRLVVFNEEDGYFLDDENVAKGFYTENPGISVFDTHIGMSFEEIDTTLGSEGEKACDQSEVLYYMNYHYVENYNVTYFAETETSPIISVIIVRGK